MTYYQEHKTAFLEGLRAFLRIPSVSALSEHKPPGSRSAAPRWSRPRRANRRPWA